MQFLHLKNLDCVFSLSISLLGSTISRIALIGSVYMKSVAKLILYFSKTTTTDLLKEKPTMKWLDKVWQVHWQDETVVPGATRLLLPCW